MHIDTPQDALVVRTIAMPTDTNPAGDIFGGWLMWQMDLAAGNMAAQSAGGRSATVAVEAMTFLKPVKVGDEVTIYARLIGTGRMSIRVYVEAWRRDRYSTAREQVTHATFTFVALDGSGRPRCFGANERARGTRATRRITIAVEPQAPGRSEQA